jgi:hypothetical protein
LEESIECFDKEVNQLQICELIIIGVDTEAEEQASITLVNDLVVSKLQMIKRERLRKSNFKRLTSKEVFFRAIEKTLHFSFRMFPSDYSSKNGPSNVVHSWYHIPSLSQVIKIQKKKSKVKIINNNKKKPQQSWTDISDPSRPRHDEPHPST